MLKGVMISGKVRFCAMLLGTPTLSILMLGSGVMTVLAKKSTLFPIRLPLIRPGHSRHVGSTGLTATTPVHSHLSPCLAFIRPPSLGRPPSYTWNSHSINFEIYLTSLSSETRYVILPCPVQNLPAWICLSLCDVDPREVLQPQPCPYVRPLWCRKHQSMLRPGPA